MTTNNDDTKQDLTDAELGEYRDAFQWLEDNPNKHPQYLEWPQGKIWRTAREGQAFYHSSLFLAVISMMQGGAK